MYSMQRKQTHVLPSRELTYPPKMPFWRWVSFSQGGICLFPGGYMWKRLKNECIANNWPNILILFVVGYRHSKHCANDVFNEEHLWYGSTESSSNATDVPFHHLPSIFQFKVSSRNQNLVYTLPLFKNTWLVIRIGIQQVWRMKEFP